MGQMEVLELLKELRHTNDNWHTSTQIKNELLIKGYSKNYINGVSDDLMHLATFNLIQIRGVGAWEHHKEFRGYKRG